MRRLLNSPSHQLETSSSERRCDARSGSCLISKGVSASGLHREIKDLGVQPVVARARWDGTCRVLTAFITCPVRVAPPTLALYT